MNETAQVKIGFAGLLVFFVVVLFVSAQELGSPLQDLNAQGLPSGEAAPQLPPSEGNVLQEQPGQVQGEEKVPPEITIVSPLFGEQVNGNVVVIVAIEPKEKITSAFFEVGSIKQELLKENNFLAEFDSRALENGEYEFKVQGCIEEACQTAVVPITVKNEEEKKTEEIETESKPQPADENETPATISGLGEPFVPVTVKIKGSNAFSALTVYGIDGNVVASGTDFVQVTAGSYSAQIDFFEQTIVTVFFEKILLDKDGLVTEIREIDKNSVPAPPGGPLGGNAFQETDSDSAAPDNQSDAKNDLTELADSDKQAFPRKNELEWVEVIAVKNNHAFSSGEIFFLPPPDSIFLFKCSDWDYDLSACRGLFEKAMEVKAREKTNISLEEKPTAFAFARKKIWQEPPRSTEISPDAAQKVKITEIDKNLSVEQDLLGIDFEKMRGNLPQGLFTVYWIYSQEENNDSFFPYYSVETNPFTGKKAFVLRPEELFERAVYPATRLVKAEPNTQYEFSFSFYGLKPLAKSAFFSGAPEAVGDESSSIGKAIATGQDSTAEQDDAGKTPKETTVPENNGLPEENRLFEISPDDFSFYLIEFGEKGTTGLSADMVQLNESMVSAGNSNFEVLYAEDAGMKKVSARFTTTENARFLRFLIIFEESFRENAKGKFFVEDIFLKKV